MHSSCGGKIEKITYLTFSYWFCHGCRCEVGSSNSGYSEEELIRMGWKCQEFNGLLCWAYKNEEFGISINTSEASSIQKLMDGGMEYPTAVVRALFSDRGMD